MEEPKGNSFLADVETLLNQALTWPHGTQALKEVCERHRGATVYVPGATDLYIAWRNRRIRDEFKGDNYEELALRWGLKERQIRNILLKGKQ